MKASFYNIGCKVNFAELMQIQTEFEKRGFEVVRFGEKSDVVIINTCTVTNNADSDSRKVIRRARRTSPEAFVGVLGCYAQLKPGDVAGIDGVDAVFGIKEKFKIFDLIDNFGKKEETCVYVQSLDGAEFDPASTVESNFRTRVTLKLQDGCDYNCSYCTIPAARGASRSMNFHQALDKFKEIDDAGIKEVILSGINLGEYKAPTGENFTDLMLAVAKQNFGFRIRISSIEPNLLTDELIELAAENKILTKHFHIPLQSGSPDILKLMRRRYKASFYEELIHKVKNRIPDCGIGADVITGFPGETDKHFRETYDLIDSLPVTYLHVFSYSGREGTIASMIKPVIDQHVIKERTNDLRILSSQKSEDFIKSQVGRIHKVIPETFNDKSKLWNGLSDNYIKINFSAPENIQKDFKQIKLTEYKSQLVLGEIY